MNLQSFKSWAPRSGSRLNTHMPFEPFEYWHAFLVILGPGNVHT